MQNLHQTNNPATQPSSVFQVQSKLLCTWNAEEGRMTETLAQCKLHTYSELKLRLKHWGRDKIGAISQTTFTNPISEKKL